MKKSKFKCYTGQIIFLILYALSALMLVGCGKRRPPVPPVPTQRATENLTAQQLGNQVILRFNLAERLKQDLKQINIYRLIEQISSPNFISEEDFASRSTLISTVNYDQSEPTTAYADTLNNKQVLKARYSAVLVFEDGRRSPYLNFAVIQPAFNIAVPPEQLASEVSQNSIDLRWQKPSLNLDGTAPTNLLGYNLYRLESDQALSNSNPRKLNNALLTDTSFADQNFEFGNEYKYFVRSVSGTNNGVAVESSNSNSITVLPRDVFAPSPPQGLTIASAPNALSLFFAANPESDVLGYNVYRSIDEEQPLDQWSKLTATSIAATTFQDSGVEAGQKYFYFVTAVDAVGNESARSEIVSEIAP